MLNSRSSSVINQNIKFNAVSGTMFKSCNQSFLYRFHLRSEIADKLLSSNPRMCLSDGYFHSVIILQTMLVGDMEVLVEIIKKEDYDSLNREESE